MRAAAMTEADLVLVIGRKLDYQLGYGSPAVFPNARFVRIADNAGELIDNRRGDPELLATPALALAAIVDGRRQPRARRRPSLGRGAAPAAPGALREAPSCGAATAAATARSIRRAIFAAIREVARS